MKTKEAIAFLESLKSRKDGGVLAREIIKEIKKVKSCPICKKTMEKPSFGVNCEKQGTISSGGGEEYVVDFAFRIWYHIGKGEGEASQRAEPVCDDCAKELQKRAWDSFTRMPIFSKRPVFVES